MIDVDKELLITPDRFFQVLCRYTGTYTVFDQKKGATLRLKNPPTSKLKGIPEYDFDNAPMPYDGGLWDGD